jgi:pyrroloquinoline quinone (PQQ) biosynthesis protein C
MGSLKPGATYVYERVDNRIYAREMGQTERQMVGWTTSVSPVMQQYRSEINQVLLMCETDPAMRELLDQLFVMYNLKKNHE